MRIDRIPIRTLESGTGMAEAIVKELAVGLTNLSSTGKTKAIDLTSLPLTETDRFSLAQTLGEGEIRITISTIGDTKIYETAYAGIWWIKHFDTEGKLLTELLEVCNIPDIVKTQESDIKAAAQQLSVEQQVEEEEYIRPSA